MKKKKYLPLYYKWMEKGELPCAGLCIALSPEEICLLAPDYYSHISYWGYDGEHRTFGNEYGGLPSEKVRTDFTPLRQNIVLFMAAMNGEM